MSEKNNSQHLFSYDYYAEIIETVKKSGKQASFHQINSCTKQFVVMRHDVEFSVERAYNLAQFEYSKNFYTSYFFQLTNNAYNVLSKRNRDMIHQISDMGHTVGLHFHLNGMNDIDVIKKQIDKEIKIIGTMLEIKIDSFSIHRPAADVLRNTIKLGGGGYYKYLR